MTTGAEVLRAGARRIGAGLAVAAIAMIVGAFGSPCWAGGSVRSYYVAPNGSDVSDGSAAAPFATIQKAADLVNPGDTVIVRDGVYTALGATRWVVELDRGGTAERPVTFRAEHQWGAVLDGRNDVTDEGFVLTTPACYITIEGLEIREFRRAGVTNYAAAHHLTVRGCHIHHIGNVDMVGLSAVGIDDSQNTSYGTYDGNIIHDIGRTGPPGQNFALDHGIYTCGDHNVITNNVFYNMYAGWGVQVAGYDTVEDLLISNNTFAFGRKQAHIVLWDRCHGVTIQNNIFYQPVRQDAITPYSVDLQDVTIRNNLVFGGGLLGDQDPGYPQDHLHYRWLRWSLADNRVGVEPQFVDPEKFDFHLRPGSPAIDVGTADLAPATDIDGNPRPQGRGYDLGAYER